MGYSSQRRFPVDDDAVVGSVDEGAAIGEVDTWLIGVGEGLEHLAYPVVIDLSDERGVCRDTEVVRPDSW